MMATRTFEGYLDVAGYHILASDGAIGKLLDMLIDDAKRGYRYLVIDTGSWWPGTQVLISPHAVREISWAERQIRLDVSRDRVRRARLGGLWRASIKPMKRTFTIIMTGQSADRRLAEIRRAAASQNLNCAFRRPTETWKYAIGADLNHALRTCRKDLDDGEDGFRRFPADEGSNVNFKKWPTNTEPVYKSKAARLAHLASASCAQ